MLNRSYMDAIAAPEPVPLSQILFIKTSSLGDVIHHMPAVSEAQAPCAGARIAWVVEEAFVAAGAAASGGDRRYSGRARRWRRIPFSPATWREIGRASGDARPAMRRDRHAGTFAHRHCCLRSRASEDGMATTAAVFASPWRRCSTTSYTRSRAIFHAIERNRLLTGLALGYAPDGPPIYGLDRERLRDGNRPDAVLLHGTARPEKEWPPENWIALGKVAETVAASTRRAAMGQ